MILGHFYPSFTLSTWKCKKTLQAPQLLGLIKNAEMQEGHYFGKGARRGDPASNRTAAPNWRRTSAATESAQAVGSDECSIW